MMVSFVAISILGALSIITLVGFLQHIRIDTLVYLTVFSIFFPIYIEIFGRDASTTGTIFIFILYFKYILDCLADKWLIKDKYDLLIYLFILIGIISIIVSYKTGQFSSKVIGPIVRQYLNLLSSLLLFLIVKNLSLYNNMLLQRFKKNLLNLIILLIAVHIAIAVIVKFFPNTGQLFNIFLTRNIEFFDSISREKMARISTFVFGHESFGEIIAVMSPLLLYKIYNENVSFWMVITTIYLVGLTFSVTRSGILLFGFGFISSVAYKSRYKLTPNLIIMYSFVFILLMFYLLYPSVFSDLYLRFRLIEEGYQASGNVFDAINRNFFPDMFAMVRDNLSLFGYGITEYNFHNLFLTVLQKRGLIGFIFYFSIMFTPLFFLIASLYKNSKDLDHDLIFACILSFSIFIINEFKFEFNRSASYQQICWAIFSIFYLIATTKSNSTLSNNEIELEAVCNLEGLKI